MGREEVQAVLGYVLGINESSLLFSAGHALGGVRAVRSMTIMMGSEPFWRGSAINPS
jgi:hypothetical protein